jgi:hypothetical protein
MQEKHGNHMEQAQSSVQYALKEFSATMTMALRALQNAMTDFKTDHLGGAQAAAQQYSGQVYPPAGAQATTPSAQHNSMSANMGCHVSRLGSSATEPSTIPTQIWNSQSQETAAHAHSSTCTEKICQHATRDWHNPHAGIHAELATTFTTLPRVKPVAEIKTSLPRLENTDASRGLSIVIEGDEGRRIILPANAPLDSGANGLFASVEAIRKNRIEMGTLQASVPGVGGAKTCAVSKEPVSIVLKMGTPYEVTVQEHVFAVEGVDHLFDFLIGYNVLHRLGGILDTNRAILAYPPHKQQGDLSTLTWIPLCTTKKEQSAIPAGMAEQSTPRTIIPGQAINMTEELAFPYLAFMVDTPEDETEPSASAPIPISSPEQEQHERWAISMEEELHDTDRVRRRKEREAAGKEVHLPLLPPVKPSKAPEKTLVREKGCLKAQQSSENHCNSLPCVERRRKGKGRNSQSSQQKNKGSLKRGLKG